MGRYFTAYEFKETIKADRKFSASSPFETRTHTYKCSSAKYEGSWLQGFRHGKGVMTWEDGAKFTGLWAHGMPTGKGTFVFTQPPETETGICDRYSGKWANNTMNGQGVLRYSNGTVYKGRWENGVQHGAGHEIWTDGEYFGEYAAGVKSGLGVYLWKDESSFAGSWQDNHINGLGAYKWSDGRTYFGEFKNGQMHGIASHKWPDGREYIGEYQNDKKHGYGIFKWPDGKVFQGWWKHGKQHGLAVNKIKTSERVTEKYTLWLEGKMERTFPVVSDQPLTKQLRRIEEQVAAENPEREEFKLFTFESSSTFTDRLQVALHKIKLNKQTLDRAQLEIAALEKL